jgi:hypothetical protein
MKGVIFVLCCHNCSINEECPDTSRHPGYYEKIYLLFFEKGIVALA